MTAKQVKASYRASALQQAGYLANACANVIGEFARDAEDAGIPDELDNLLESARLVHSAGLRGSELAPDDVVRYLARATEAARKQEREAVLSHIADQK